MKVRPYFTMEKVQKLADKTPKYTLFTSPDPQSHYKNDTVVMVVFPRKEIFFRHPEIDTSALHSGKKRGFMRKNSVITLVSHIPYYNCMGVPISCLITVGSNPVQQVP